MKCSFGISDFLEEIPSLSYSVVFLYFFALIAEEGFLISSCYSLELCIQMFVSFLFSFAFTLLFFSEMARVNVDILGISELKWTGMGQFNSDDHYIYYCGQESLRRNGLAIMVNNESKLQYLDAISKTTE